MIMVRVLDGDETRVEFRHHGCVDAGERVDSTHAPPPRPNRYDYTTTRCRTKYERALSEFHCGRCGEPLYSDQTRVETIFDDVIAALECSQCHQRDRETIGSLSDQRTLVCEGCATLIDIDGRALGLALGAAPHVLEGFWRDAAAVGGRVLREA